MNEITEKILNLLFTDSDSEKTDQDDSSDKTSLSALNSRMKNGTVKFSYKRKNGSIRKARGTLQQKKMPSRKQEPGPKKPDSVFVYWDLDKNDYRSFRRKNFIQALSESGKANLTIKYDIGKDEVETILDTANISNSRYDRRQFGKYLGLTDLVFCGVFENDECRAMAVLDIDKPNGHVYIAECQAFVSGGFGACLLMDIIRKYQSVWLLADPTADQKLLEYYRRKQFRFSEYVLPDSIWGPAHFFYTRFCDESVLRAYIDEKYSN